MANSFELVRTVVADLSAAGLGPLVFGGWAEELLGLTPPRTHSDIDLLVVAEAPAADVFVIQRREIVQKRFSHKRAFVEDGVVVELFLVDRREGVETTSFWDSRRWTWPPLEPVMVDGLPVAPAAALAAYRTHHDNIAGARITSTERARRRPCQRPSIDAEPIPSSVAAALVEVPPLASPYEPHGRSRGRATSGLGGPFPERRAWSSVALTIWETLAMVVGTAGIRHVHLLVADLERSIKFYGDAFGMREKFRDGDELVFLNTPGTHDSLALHLVRNDERVGQNGGYEHFGITVLNRDELDEAIRVIEAAGGTLVDRGEHAPGAPYAYVRDPDGYVIEI